MKVSDDDAENPSVTHETLVHYVREQIYHRAIQIAYKLYGCKSLKEAAEIVYQMRNKLKNEEQ